MTLKPEDRAKAGLLLVLIIGIGAFGAYRFMSLRGDQSQVPDTAAALAQPPPAAATNPANGAQLQTVAMVGGPKQIAPVGIDDYKSPSPGKIRHPCQRPA